MQMLVGCAGQGVTDLVLTPHFYPDEEYPDTFLKRRKKAVEELRAYAPQFRQQQNYYGPLPTLYLGAEVYYFPSMSCCEDLPEFKITATDYLLVEPPMMHWTDAILDEIEQAGENFNFTPVIAHVDRYMTMLEDFTLFDRLRERRMLIQVNADFFLNPAAVKYALTMLQEGRIRFIGSDCHNLTSRPPKLGLAAEIITNAGLQVPEF